MNKRWTASIIFAVVTLLVLIWLDTYPNGRGGDRLGGGDNDKWWQIKKRPRPMRKIGQVFSVSPPLTHIEIVQIPNSESKAPLKRLRRWIDKTLKRW